MSLINQFINFFQPLLNYKSLFFVSWVEIKLKYSRSFLGPLWITLSMFINIAVMGFVFGSLFGMPLREFFPYVAIGTVVWNYIAAVIIDSSVLYVQSESYIRNLRLPISFYVYKMLLKNVIIFSHNVLIIPVLFLILGVSFDNVNIFLLVFGLVLLNINLISISILVAPLCTRFRDVPMIVASALQMLFYATPIMWKVSQLPIMFASLVQYNPFYHLIQIIRDSLIGGSVYNGNYLLSCVALTLIFFTLSVFIVLRTTRKLAYWI